MLVLSRKVNEKIVLPGLNVTIQVLELSRGVVRLGIDAPREVVILREEVRTRDQARNSELASSGR